MSLSDVMSSAGLTVFPIVGLILFLLAFVVIAVQIVRRGRSQEAHALLPLEDQAQPDQPRPQSPEAPRV